MLFLELRSVVDDACRVSARLFQAEGPEMAKLCCPMPIHGCSRPRHCQRSPCDVERRKWWSVLATR